MICSIAMNTYNGSRFLEKQLDSLSAQTRPADEIIISDDGSADDTPDIIARFCSTHPELSVTVLPEEGNQGFRASFKRAILACRGDIIFFCDQDDIWPANKIERFEQIFEQNPHVLSLISDFATIDAEGKRLHPEAKSENLWVSDRVMDSKDVPCKITLSEMLGRNQGQGCAMAVRRCLAEEYASLGETYIHDWIFNLLAAIHGGLYFLPEQLLLYRLHGHNVIGMAQGEHAQRRIPLLRKSYELALAFKYSYLEGKGDEARKSLNSVKPEILDFIFSRIPCEGREKTELAAWQALQKKRMALIEDRRPIAYLLFFLTHLRFFKEMAYFSTYEQAAIRMMTDLCAMKKA